MRSRMTVVRRSLLLPWLCLLVFCAIGAQVRAGDWLPVSPDELAMTREPGAPGAHAIYLYRQVDRDDVNSQEREYVRIKILTEEGRAAANVEISFNQRMESIHGIEARTIRADGTVAVFNGTIYEKPLLSSDSVKLLSKTFTIPEAEVGSIIEYHYTRRFNFGYIFDSRWILSQSLFTRYAKFSLLPSPHFTLTWNSPRGLPEGTEPAKKGAQSIRLEVHNIPAFVTEEFMPPANEMKYRVDFVYLDASIRTNDATAFWKDYAQRQFKSLNAQTGKPDVLRQALAQIVAPEDSAEAKLRKIYARTQQIHNLSYERPKSEAEQQRDGQADIHTVQEVLARGRGSGMQINLLFMSLAQAAGLQADFAYVAPRDAYFFDSRFMNAWVLNDTLVVVKLEGQDRFFSPGTPFMPFGLLPWSETAVRALRVDKNGGTWIPTPIPTPSDSRVERRATLTFDRGTLRGHATVTYTGLEAQWRRSAQSDEDATARTKFLEDWLRWYVPSGINTKLTNTPDWEGFDTPLVADFDFEIPGWAAGAGQRALLPVGIFSNEERHLFEFATRVQPLYFQFPYEHEDDVTIELPAGVRLTSLPKAQNVDLHVLAYSTTAENTQRTLHLHRKLLLNATLVDAKFYGQVRDFFQAVRSADEEQVVVSPDNTAASH